LPGIFLTVICILLISGCSGCQKKVKVVTEKPPAPKVVERKAPPPPPEPEPAPEPAPEPEPEPEKPREALTEAEPSRPRPTTEKLETIHFDFDDYTLRPDARRILAQNAEYLLNTKPDIQISIEGYCDERGTAQYNLALGERRARSAYQYLADLDVDPGRMKWITYGEQNPVDAGHNESAWALNRRAEFVEITGR